MIRSDVAAVRLVLWLYVAFIAIGLVATCRPQQPPAAPPLKAPPPAYGRKVV